MKSVGIITRDLGWLVLCLGAFCACDSKHTLIEAFLQNGAETKLFTYGGHSFELGRSVAIGSNVALAGAYIYRWDGGDWVKEANLRSSNGSFGLIGRSVALNGNVAVVGEYGAVYVFRFNGSRWQEEAVLTPDIDDATPSEFGYAVSIDGDVVAIGKNTESRSSAGTLYLYRFDGSRWVEEAKLAAGARAYGFGYSVSVSGNVVIAGAWGTSVDDVGIVYVYRFTGSRWQEEAQLTANDAIKGGQFGHTVAVSSIVNVAIVGAPYDDASGENSGSAYVYRYSGSGWRQEAKLNISGTANAFYGSTVAVEGNTAIIGASFNTERYYETADIPGAAYLYRWDGSAWREQKKLAASDGVAGNRFGAAVSLSGRLAIVGAPGDYSNNGAAYVYVID